MISPEVLSILVPIAAATVMAMVGLYVKDMVIDSIEKHLTKVLPGLFAIQFATWRDKSDTLYAPHEVVNTVQRLEERVKIMELKGVGG